MITHLSLLRGINVAGHRKIKMPELKSLFEANGFENVQTYLQSGNILFSHSDTSSKISSHIEAFLETELGYPVSVLTFDKNTFLNLAQDNPLFQSPNIDPAFLHLTFLFTPPTTPIPPEDLPLQDDEQVKHHHHHYYLYCPHGYGRTKINNSYFERKHKAPATTRNWKTITALTNLLLVTA